jgi:hypothetical protein
MTYKNCLHYCLLLLFISHTCGNHTQAREITQIVLPPIEKSSEKTGSFFPRVLELALNKTVASHGPYQISSYPFQLTNSRFISELSRNGAINLMWTMTDPDREKKLRPIKISLLKELNSYRIFLIRKGDEARFSQIKTLEDLRQFRAGQGKSWPDTVILQQNKLPVMTSVHYELLFEMLVANRFDYFPRGLYEIWDEYEIHKKQDLVIEPHIILYYHAPIYFFTSKENKALADRIETGLKIAIADGSFDELFYSYKGFRVGEEALKNHSRRLFELKTDF